MIPTAKKTKISEDDAVNELRQQLAARDKEVKNLNEKINDLNDAVVKKDEEVAAAKREVTQVKKEVTQVKKRAEQDIKEKSVLAVLRSNDFPSIEPLKCTGTSYSHIYTKHEPASFTQNEFKVHDVYPVVNVPEFDFRNLTSKLLAEKQNVRPGEKHQYDNESDLRSSVNDAISDTVKICNEMIRLNAAKKGQTVPFYLQWRTEATLFSNIIDHVVIYDYRSNTPILAVEAKKHLPKSFQENSEYTILGQCFDQLRELRLMGHFCPFGALTSFNETIITWLDTEIHTKVLHDHEKNGLRDHPFFEEIIDYSRTNCPMGSQSPPKLRQSEEPGQASRVSPDSQFSSVETTAAKRSIVLSTKRFKQNQIVDVLANIVFCSLNGFFHRPMTILDLVVDTNVTVDDAIGLTKTKYEWQSLSVRYKGPLTYELYQRNAEPKKMYLISYLGMGATSKVYRAISESGHGCVVKLYVQRRDEGNQIMEKKKFIKFSTDLAIKEEMNFKEIYPELAEYVWRDQLNELQCLVMPFFAPISKDERKSNDLKNHIREQLQRFGEKKKMFRKCDQLWRHVGFFQERVYLFDLGDLIDVPVAEQPSNNDQSGDRDIDRLISEHLAKLTQNQ